MKDLPETDVPQETGALIDHIQTRGRSRHFWWRLCFGLRCLSGR